MIIVKSKEELLVMRQAGRIVAKVLDELKNFVRQGRSTKQIDDLVNRIVNQEGAEPAFLGYRGFPASVCTSVNEQVVHAIPRKNVILNDGDIISLDVGVKYQGYYGDAAITLPIGEIDREAQNLIKVTRQALHDGIEQAQVGNRLHDVSATIQRRAENHGYSVVREFVGHGIGQKMHEDPQIPNYGQAGTGPILKEGMVLALEPMVNAGVADVKVLDDDWTVVTADSKLSAHFEHTVAITKDGPEILTKL